MQKTVVITGSSSGIGRATVLYFQSKGWNVAATMRQPDKEHELGQLPRVKLYQLDVTSQESIDSAVSAIYNDFGKVDVLVNNAGYAVLGIFEAASRESITRQFETNVFGLMAVTKSFLPHFRAQKQGTIVNVASVGGRLAFPLYSLYHATKWAVDGFSESLAYELQPFQIKVRIIEPGLIKTDFYGRSQELLTLDNEPTYQQLAGKAEKTIAQFTKHGSKPEAVAKAIFKASTSQSNRLRYPVAGGAPLFLFFRWLVPPAIFRAFTKKIYFG